MDKIPFFTSDTIVFGIIMLCLGFVFYTSSIKNKFWQGFYKYVPAILLCYLLPAIFNSLGFISPHWEEITANGEVIEKKSQVYYIASRYLLPASLVLMTLSIDLKAILNLGPKALIMFITGTIGIIIGGPIAILLISLISPETVGGSGFDAIWRGLSTIAGSWIGVGLAHWGADTMSLFLSSNFPVFNDKSSALSSFTSTFFWMVTIATAIGIFLSFTKVKQYEGAGASKIGSIFIYILVATIGMKMDLTTIFEKPGLIAIGLVWMTIHALLLIIMAKAIKAPFFFLAVGSQANVGGAASAPVVAAAFHPSLASVGVLLAVFGYVAGTYGAILCTVLMQIASRN